MESLLARVAQLERELHAVRHSSENDTVLWLPTPAAMDAERTLEHLPVQAQNNIPSVDSPVDAMGGTAGPEDSPNVSNKFYGSSSALSFTRQVYSDILRTEAAHSPPRNSVASIPRPIQANSFIPTTVEPETFSLLPRHLTDHLISLYWSRVHVLYPFVHRASFNQAYEDLWKSSASQITRNKPGFGLGAAADSGPSSIVFHCAFNAMLALGMQFSTQLSIEKRERLSFVCMEKSKKLLQLDLFDDGNISLVQTLLLLTQYFQSTTCPSKCWTSMGLACRLAQGLGLHVESTDRQFENTERELRKRVWHGCVTMDIAISMALGRPTMLMGDSHRSLPEPVDEHDWITLTDPETPKASIIAFFAESVRLCRVVENILLGVYKLNEHEKDRNQTSDAATRFDVLVDIDHQLSNFARNLPPTLSWVDPESYAGLDPTGILLRQSNVLYVRYLHARIQLYRPVFFQSCRVHSKNDRPQSQEAEETSPVAASFSFHSALICVRTALDLISMLKQYAGTEATGAWWYNMFYTRTAAMIVLVTAVCPPLYESIGKDTWDTAWSDCQTIMTKQLPQFATVRACSKTLEALHEHVMRHLSQSRLESGTNGVGNSQDPQPAGPNTAVGEMGPSTLEGAFSELISDQFSMETTYDPVDFFHTGMYSDLIFEALNMA